MGLDLALYPDQWERARFDSILATVRLPLERDYDLFGRISHINRTEEQPICKPRPLADIAPKGLHNFEDEGLVYRLDDPYGDPLTYLSARELAAVPCEDSSTWNKAVFAMIRALPPGTTIVLWWH